MSKTEQVADLVQCNRFHIKSIRVTSSRNGPAEYRGRIEKNVGLYQLPGQPVESKARRTEHSIKVRPIREPDRAHPVFLHGTSRRKAHKLRRELRERYGGPGYKRPG